MSLLNFVIWHHVVVGWEEEGASGALALPDVMPDSVDVTILPMVEGGVEEGEVGEHHHLQIGICSFLPLDGLIICSI